MNKQSSVGLTEELLTNLINMVALEYHLRITHEKYYSLLHVKNVQEDARRSELTSLMSNTRELLERTTEQRRGVMRVLSNLGTEEANPDMWCAVKHASVQMITMFEAWQVDLDNTEVEELYHSAVELFNMTVANFLGYMPQPCSACFADAIQSQEELNELQGLMPASSQAQNAESVLARAKEVFGSEPKFVLEAGQGE